MSSRFRSIPFSKLPQKALLAAVIGLALSGCGNGEQVEELTRTWQQIANQGANGHGSWDQGGLSGSHPTPLPPKTPHWTLDTEASIVRFLAQASYGATPTDLKRLKGTSANEWIEREFSKPRTSLLETLDSWTKLDKKATPSLDDLHNVWWFSTMQNDQLRQRMAYSLSQIFVVSSSGAPGFYPRGMASYYDVLSKHAFGNFRDLLNDVVRHPMMGLYLSHLRNQKEQYTQEGVRYRAPDENFAREIMQLFTIGLEQLNIDGTPKLGLNGAPTPTYSNQDIVGLARVFTGWSWSGPTRSAYCFTGWHESCNDKTNPGRDVRLMVPYPEFHSIEEKRFLGTTIPRGMALPEENLKIALDTLFKHPNVGPFISKQLIQRLVVSNPSPAYVERVALVFNNNGAGIRGDLKAVLRAILLDPEARTPEAASRPEAGRIREPLLRVTQWMRAFKAVSNTGRWGLRRTDGYPRSIYQTAMRAPSVFNFYRPGYTPPNTPIAEARLVAPEMQITQESSIAGYAYYIGVMTGAFWETSYGIGPMGNFPNPAQPSSIVRRRDIYPDYSTEAALAKQPEKLVDHLNTLLMNGQMKADTRQLIIEAVKRIEYPPNMPSRVAETNTRRVGLAIYMVMMSTDYLVLK